MLRFRQDAETALAAADRLSTLRSRSAWREEKARLDAKRTVLTSALAERQSDAASSDAAGADFTRAKAAVDALSAALDAAPMPRALPPVAGELEVEPGIVARSAAPDDVFAWAAGLGGGERAALERRIASVEGGGRARGDDEDVFAVALVGYLAHARLLFPFRKVLQNPRHFDRRAYELARSTRDDGTPAPTEAGDTAAAVADAGPVAHGDGADEGAASGRDEHAATAPVTTPSTPAVQRSADPAGSDMASGDEQQIDAAPRPASIEPTEWRRLLSRARSRDMHLDSIIAQSPQLAGALDETMRAVEQVAGEDYAYTVSFKLARHGLIWESSRERREKFERDRRGAALETERQIAEREGEPALAGELACDVSEGVTKQQGKVAGAAALGYLQEIQTSLLPAFRSSVDALDAASAFSVATRLLLGLRAADRAQQDLRSVLSLPVAPPSSTDTGGMLEQIELIQEHVLLSQRMQEVNDALTRQLGPTTFRGVTITEGAPPAARVRSVVNAAEAEASATISLLASVETILAHANATRDGLRVSLDTDQRRAITNEVLMWRGRPVNYAFLRHVLDQLGIWIEVEHELRGDSAIVAANAERFGDFADVGDYEESSIVAMLSRVDVRGINGNPDQGEERGARRAFDAIGSASPDARAAIILHLAETKRNRGEGTCFDHLMRYLPGQLRERLAELVMEGRGPDAQRAFRLIQPHYINLDQQTTMGDIVGDGWLATGYDVLTGGAYSEIVAAQEARREGLVTDGQANLAMKRAGARGVALTAVAGAFGELGGIVGGKLAQRFGQDGLMALLGRSTVTGAAAGVGGQFGADVLDQATGVKNGWSSPGQYATAGAIGAGFGVLAAGVSVAAGRHLPPDQRTPPQQLAAMFPNEIGLLETLSASAGKTIKIRVPRRRAVQLGDRGILGGPIPAYEGGAPGRGDVAVAGTAADDVVLDVVVDAQLGAGGGPLAHVLQANRLDDDASLDYDEAFDPRHAPEGYADLDEFEGGFSIRTGRDAYVVDQEGGVVSDQHHVFPKDDKHQQWFKDRGIDVHDFTVTLDKNLHETLHAMNWSDRMMERLAEAEAALGPGQRLSREQIIQIGERMMKAHGIDPATAPFERWRSAPARRQKERRP